MGQIELVISKYFLFVFEQNLLELLVNEIYRGRLTPSVYFSW